MTIKDKKSLNLRCIYCGGKFLSENFTGTCPICLLKLEDGEVLYSKDNPVYTVLSKPEIHLPPIDFSVKCVVCGNSYDLWELFRTQKGLLCKDCTISLGVNQD